MKAIMVMFDSLNRRFLPPYGCQDIQAPNFSRLANHAVTFDRCYIGSMPCMPARRELHTGRYNFLHRSWGPLEPFDDSMPEILKKHGIYTHLTSDHQHYWEDGGATYHSRYNSWEISRGQEGDLWKGMVKDPDMSGYYRVPNAAAEAMKKVGIQDLNRQDAINRLHIRSEAEMPQARTFKYGLQFLEENHQEDHWFLQIETFDPHEPFFASRRFQEMYPDPDYTGAEFDWPPYGRVTQSDVQVEHCRKRYKALVNMCDYYLGTILDAMDQYDLWKDTMLIVNTDHGFLLGEHRWWAKSVMPYYNEVAHIPLFIWDPRHGITGEHRQALVQTIDLAPTLLAYFGIEKTMDMMGYDLEQVTACDIPVRETALFGSHGNHINITDGHYVYMRAPAAGSRAYEYTLMPTRMRNRCAVSELADLTLAEPFVFTKGCRTLRIPGQQNPFANMAQFGTCLYDVENDPKQLNAIEDPAVELRLIHAMEAHLRRNDAPEELYENFGLSKDRDLTVEAFMAQKQSEFQRAVRGLEGYSFTRRAFLMINLLLGLIPEPMGQQLIAGIKRGMADREQKEIDSQYILEFAGRLPFPKDMKGMLMQMLENCIED